MGVSMKQTLDQSIELKHRVLRCIDRPIDQITVTDICAACGISRQTFYTHFKSKYDIAYWYLALAEDLYLFEVGRSLSLSAGLSAFFAFLYEEKEALSLAFEKEPSKDELRVRLERTIGQLAMTLQDLGVELTEDKMFCLGYTVESANCLVAGWCLRGMEVPPEVMARRVEMCVPQALIPE